MNNYGFSARTITLSEHVEVSNGPLVVELDSFGDEVYSNIKKGTPQYDAALRTYYAFMDSK